MKQGKGKTAFKKTLNAYRSTEVLTANKEAILLMLYEGAIRFLKQAIEAVNRNDIQEKSRLIGRTQDIINELRATLNHKQGGELAGSLDSLYGFITDRLIEASKDNRTEKLIEAFSVLTTLHEAWQQAIASVKNEKKFTENR